MSSDFNYLVIYPQNKNTDIFLTTL